MHLRHLLAYPYGLVGTRPLSSAAAPPRLASCLAAGWGACWMGDLPLVVTEDMVGLVVEAAEEADESALCAFAADRAGGLSVAFFNAS